MFVFCARASASSMFHRLFKHFVAAEYFLKILQVLFLQKKISTKKKFVNF